MVNLKIGDRVACNLTDLKRSLNFQDHDVLISGEIIKIYDVTGMRRQVMIKTKTGLKFHAPIQYWRKI